MEAVRAAKLKFALYWAAACGGCDVAVPDINGKILDIADMLVDPAGTFYRFGMSTSMLKRKRLVEVK